MPIRRTSVLVTSVAVLASMLTVVGSSAAAAPSAAAPSVAPSVARSAVPTADSARVVGQPPANYVIPATSYFSYPNGSAGDKRAIRSRLLRTINSVWGGPRAKGMIAGPSNGTIRIATWSFEDRAIANALIKARARGVSVQIVGAKSRNQGNPTWKLLKKKLGTRLYPPGKSAFRERTSFARECRGACRGPGGTPHAKYMLFNNVGPAHVRNVTVQTSMNLTNMGWQGQWNQAEAWRDAGVYRAFLTIFQQSRVGRASGGSYRAFTSNGITSIFFPLRPGNSNNDPVMRALNRTRCTGSTVTGSGRTRIRIIQYSLYGDRGVWIAKRLRQLWNQGCDIRLITSISSRGVIEILRNGSGRGAIPVRQSVITNSEREIVKYNHSKWMTIVGNYNGAGNGYLTQSGSANWSAFAFTGDEQLQEFNIPSQAARHNQNFDRTWAQPSSHLPGYGIKPQPEGRVTESMRIASFPETIPWGKGIYKYLSPNGG